MEDSNGEIGKSPQRIKDKLESLGKKVGQILRQPLARLEKGTVIQPNKTTASEDRDRIQEKEMQEELIIIPPDPALLKEALSIDPRVKYLPFDAFDNIPGNITMRIWITGELAKSWNSPKDVAIKAYQRLADMLVNRTFKDNPLLDSIGIRGSAINIGETFSTTRRVLGTSYNHPIKGMREVVETGYETPFSSSLGGYINWQRGDIDNNIDRAGGNTTGQYAYGYSRIIRDSVPPQQKHLIFPMFLVRQSSDTPDFYILDRIEFKKAPEGDPARKTT